MNVNEEEKSGRTVAKSIIETIKTTKFNCIFVFVRINFGTLYIWLINCIEI